MNIALGSDHAGYSLKEKIKKSLDSLGHSYNDFGAFNQESVDYPDFAFAVGEAVVSDDYDLGILVCATGIGISIAANKVKGIRAAHCTDTYSAKMCRRHNDANVLAVGAAITGEAIALELVEVFLSEEFEGGRHKRRTDKIDNYN